MANLWCMFPRVLNLFTDLYDAATATALARAATAENTLRHELLDGALRSLCAADELLAERQRAVAMEHLLKAMALLKDAVIVNDDIALGMPDPAAVAIDLACRVCEAIDLLSDAGK